MGMEEIRAAMIGVGEIRVAKRIKSKSKSKSKWAG